jgi:catechol 2,3-dioxygenase-like lactoylglutathione lyase family enzyme
VFKNFQINMLVDDVEKCVSFYKAIGFEETYRTPATGAPAHVEVRAVGLTLGASSIKIAREDHDLYVSGGDNTVQLCLWCDDLDAAYAKMLQAGARAVREPRDFQNGRLRNGWVRDPSNNLVQLAHERW